MKVFPLDSAPLRPVSHDPALKKRVLVEDAFSCVRHLSHIILPPGAKASSHSHENAYEVFYCVSGKVSFKINGKDVLIREKTCLIVDPGDIHSIDEVPIESELVYFLAFA